MKARLGLTAMVALALTATAYAGSWSVPSGELPGVLKYSNGHDINGLYGDPSMLWTTGTGVLLFNPDGFVAEAANEQTDTVSDTVSVDLELLGPYSVATVTATELGSYSISDQACTVDVTTVLTLTEIDGLGRTLQTTFTETYDISTWSSLGTLDLSMEIPFWQKFNVSLSNTLTAYAPSGETARISKTASATQVSIAYIPEPASVALIILAGIALLRRR